MSSVYVIQDKDKNVWAATYEEPEAIKICRQNNSTYRMVPFFTSAGTEITVKAGPIPKEYLTKKE